MKDKIKYLIIILFVLIGLSYYFYNSTNHIVFELIGQNDLELKTSQDYEEKGFTALDCNLFSCKDITSYVITENNININVPGQYVLKYVLTYNKLENVLERKVNVVERDKVAPQIKLNGESVEYVLINSLYQEKNAVAIDNIDGDISERIKIDGNVNTAEAGSYIIKYSVADSDFNSSSIERNVIVVKPIVNSIEDFDSYIDSYVKNHHYSVSIGYYNLDNGYTYKYNSDVVYYGASLIKTLDALYAYEKMELTPIIKSNVASAISFSNNTAHKYLLGVIGFDNLRNYGKSLGAKYVLNNGNGEYCGSTIVDDQLIYWKYLWNFVNNNPNGEELKSYFINTKDNYIKFTDDLVFMHKYGCYDIYFHDVGIVFDSSPYIVVILTKERRNNYQKIISEISKMIYDFNFLVKLKS